MSSDRSRQIDDGNDLAHALREEWKRVENLAAEQVRRALRAQFLAQQGVTQPAKHDSLHARNIVQPVSDEGTEAVASTESTVNREDLFATTKIVVRKSHAANVENLVAAKVVRRTTQRDDDTEAQTKKAMRAARVASEETTPERLAGEGATRLARATSTIPWHAVAGVAMVGMVIAAFFWLS